MKNKLITTIICLACLATPFLFSCGNSPSKNINESSFVELAKYDLNFKVDFVPNILFSKYDVELIIDDTIKEYLQHGQDFQKQYTLEEGEHRIEFRHANDSSIHNSVNLTLDENMEVEYKIECESDTIEINRNHLYRESETSNDEIRVSESAYSYIDKNYKEVEAALKKQGFCNIKTTPIYDIYWGITETESIKSIMIDSCSDFSSGDIFNKNAEIIIEYHMLCDDDPNKKTTQAPTTVKTSQNKDNTIATTTTSDEFDYEGYYDELELICNAIIDKSYVDGREFLNKRGYEAYYQHEVTGINFNDELDFYTDQELNDAGFIITDILGLDVEGKRIVVAVNTVDNRERIASQKSTEEKLEENFNPTYALGALEIYGKKMYPAGFSIHMGSGMLAETAIDDNTWFMKYKATVTNEFGTDMEVICEGKIRGPEDNPTVYDFYIY